jgi:hypothetical protein
MRSVYLNQSFIIKLESELEAEDELSVLNVS